VKVVRSALGFAARHSGHSDRMEEETTITPYRDGPLLVRGSFRLLDQDGNPIANEREVVALCRCGKSRIRPFCDGSHKLVRFKAPSGAERGRDRV
jgi:CDGSH-type Zn-finger protein